MMTMLMMLMLMLQDEGRIALAATKAPRPGVSSGQDRTSCPTRPKYDSRRAPTRQGTAGWYGTGRGRQVRPTAGLRRQGPGRALVGGYSWTTQPAKGRASYHRCDSHSCSPKKRRRGSQAKTWAGHLRAVLDVLPTYIALWHRHFHGFCCLDRCAVLVAMREMARAEGNTCCCESLELQAAVKCVLLVQKANLGGTANVSPGWIRNATRSWSFLAADTCFGAEGEPRARIVTIDEESLQG
jgi:hypothetical protein